MPPSVAGLRLRELFEQALPQHGATLIPQQKVTSLTFAGDGATLATDREFNRMRASMKRVL
jgi:glycerol-3-phosphate dehydrogenase subunit B